MSLVSIDSMGDGVLHLISDSTMAYIDCSLTTLRAAGFTTQEIDDSHDLDKLMILGKYKLLILEDDINDLKTIPKDTIIYWNYEKTGIDIKYFILYTAHPTKSAGKR